MRKILFLLFFAFILSGCATYKFQKSTAPANQGYFVTYDGEPYLEYTVGKDKALPDLALAKERFKRRKSTVEYYFKQTGQMESRLREYLWDTPTMLVDFVGGVLRWPFIAVADYKYNHDPKYKARADRLDEEKEAFEKARVNSLKEKLAIYIAEDLAKENLPSAQTVAAPAAPVVPAVVQAETPKVVEAVEAPKVSETPKVEAPVIKEEIVPAVVEAKPAVVETPVIKKILELPVAVITAKPGKGFSPLMVKFSGQKSYSKNGKIVAYDWDFGDGDTSNKKNPENTYWSTTFAPRYFTVTLTVKDAAGATSSSTLIIEVNNP